MEKKTEKTAFVEFWSDIKKHKKLFCVILPLTFVVSALLSLSIPNYYSCTVKLAPEASGNRGSGSLANLASSFGVNLGNQGSGGDAIVPSLYPDLMNSVTFKASLFPVKVQLEGDSAMTYYDYLLNHQKLPWWTSAIKSLKNRFTEKHESKKVNPFRLTNEQASIINLMNKKVVCDVDDNTMVISINVTDQDPLIAATMADSVQMHLQEFITEYRTRKARIDLAYSQKLFKEAKERYEKARKRSASFNDANQKAFLSRVRSEASDLENEMQLQLRAYSQVAAQLQLAEAKVQEDTPAFTLLQPATVPVKKDGPKRSVFCFLILLLAFIVTTMFVLKKEKHLKAFFIYLRSIFIRDSFDEEDYYIISRLPSSQEKKTY
jgi:hypothetical protein